MEWLNFNNNLSVICSFISSGVLYENDFFRFDIVLDSMAEIDGKVSNIKTAKNKQTITPILFIFIISLVFKIYNY